MVYDGASGESAKLETWGSITALPPEIHEIVKHMKAANVVVGDNGNNEKKAFEIVHVLIENEQFNEFKLFTDCDNVDNPKTFCTSAIKNDFLKYVTYLQIDRVNQIGKPNKPVLEMFPILRTLNVNNNIATKLSGGDVVEISFVKVHALIIEVTEKIIQLYYALDGDCIWLSNPNGLDKLGVNLILGGKLQVYGKWKLPKKIRYFAILCKHSYSHLRGNYQEPESAENLEKQTLILKDAEFDNVHLKLCELKVDNKDWNLDYKSILEFARSNINKKVKIDGTQEPVNNMLSAVFELGWQDKLWISYTSRYIRTSGDRPKSYDIPYIHVKHAYFDKSQFANCKYGHTFLRDEKSSKYKLPDSERIVFIIRGYYFTMATINYIVQESRKEFSNIDNIRVYAYNIDVDIEPNNVIAAGKKIEINYILWVQQRKALLVSKLSKKLCRGPRITMR